MNETIQEWASAHNACAEARAWIIGKTWEEVYAKCDKASWLIWVFARTQPDKRLVVRAAGTIANTVRHLMQDPRSIAAVDAALAYGRGEIGYRELNAAADAAYTAAYSAYSTYTAANAAAYTAAYSAEFSSDAAYTATYTAANADLFRRTITFVQWKGKE